MANWVILAGKTNSISQHETPHKLITVKDYLVHPNLFRKDVPSIINLASSYSYQARGYYASLLASSRGHRIIPSIETIIDLSEPKLYANALPELEQALNKCLLPDAAPPPKKLRVFFGHGPDTAYERFSKLLFDWFRAPAVEVTIKPGEQWHTITRVSLLTAGKLDASDKPRFLDCLDEYTKRQWRDVKRGTPARYTFATLFNAKEPIPPSSVASLKHWARIASKMSVDVEPIGARDLAKLANYDALFIRETTAISNHTYRFARRAEQENMPVIDDPVSMIRCTNKVYLNELMALHKVPVPDTVVIAGLDDLGTAENRLGFPMVIKAPDSAFSRGVKKVNNPAELVSLCKQWLGDSDLLIAQRFMPTEFDWRVGVLAGKPLFVCQYLMAKRHWQIVNHNTKGRAIEGGFNVVSLADAPPAVIDIAVRGAKPIGDGLYGVDLKETADGVVLIEVNDNPNLEHGIEDSAEKDEVWRRVTQWFIDKLERQRG